MEKASIKLIIIFLLIPFLGACSGASEQGTFTATISPITTISVQPSETVSISQDQKQSEVPTTPTRITPENYETFVALIPSEKPKPTSTRRPTQTSTLVPPTPFFSVRTSTVNPTIEAFGSRCEAPATAQRSQLSPDGTWITIACQGDAGVVDSHLRVMSISGNEDWAVYYADYAGDTDYNSDNVIYPYHWSQDGSYLYVTSPSRTSGCCWFGSETVLIRLNLENGQQTEIASVIQDEAAPTVDLSFSPSERYLLYIPQSGKYSLIILDLGTWRTRTIELENPVVSGAGHMAWSDDEEKIILMVLEWDESHQRFLYSLVLVKLDDGAQKTLLANQEYSRSDSLYPVRWIDADNVLISNNSFRPEDGDQWVLNIHTAKLTEIANP